MSTNPRLTPSRLAYRASSDPEVIRKILNQESICTISYADNGQAYALPTAFVLHNDHIVFHGSAKSHFLEKLTGQPVCLTVFAMNALVLAASAFHHSMNYESVVLFGEPKEITDPEEKVECLRAFTEKIVPGRWEHLRPITDGEVKATRVLAIPLKEVSCKVRQGGPSDDKQDEHFPVWTGVIPVSRNFGEPEAVGNKKEMPLPAHITALYEK